MPPKPCKCGSTTHARTSHRDCGFNTSAIEAFALSGDFDAALREVQRIRAEIDAQVPARAEVEALDAPLAQDPPLAADPLEVCPCCAMSLHTLTTCVAQDETDGGRMGAQFCMHCGEAVILARSGMPGGMRGHLETCAAKPGRMHEVTSPMPELQLNLFPVRLPQPSL